jgi:hypothetical protein
MRPWPTLQAAPLFGPPAEIAGAIRRRVRAEPRIVARWDHETFDGITQVNCFGPTVNQSALDLRLTVHDEIKNVIRLCRVSPYKPTGDLGPDLSKAKEAIWGEKSFRVFAVTPQFLDSLCESI